MTISLLNALAGPSASTQPPGKFTGKSASGKSASDKSAEQAFLDYAKMTPAQRMRASMLSKLGITEEQFKAMDAASRHKIEDKIRDMIKQQAGKTNETPTGLITDKSV
ncbi:hypothetical protein [Bradyrhizobium sp. 2TAF24]|uniref:hypothetical protein n=1 Tax=Bradyrhizobium sp. 2TAF24 TaxID=3233011 RepID=UPI003F934B5E